MKYGLLALGAFGALLSPAALAQHPGGAHGRSGPVVIRHGGGPMTGSHGPRFEMHRRGGGHVGAHLTQRRFQRGFIIPPLFNGPRFHVQNWQLYGFAQPPRDHRWVRHYDDAYLIDGGGRIRDHRYDLDWDRYGEPWDMDDGVPVYGGHGDFGPDHGYAGDDDDYDDRYAHDRGCGACDEGPVRVRTFVPPPHPAPYGYGYGQPIIVETTVTTGAPTVTTEIVEEVVEVRRRPARRHYRARPAQHGKLIHGERG